MNKNVALVLASGGARGMAHIGAIEELERRGYHITSIAGTSAGALVAGLYATGKLKEAKQWFMSLDKQKIMSLGDFSLSTSYLVKGDKIIDSFKEIVDDCLIEDLPIPVSLVASDVIHNREVVMESGSLFQAVRASVSIPMFFRPVKKDDMLLIDGGVLNALPLNRVRRTEGDILVAMNISAPDSIVPENKNKRNNRVQKLLENKTLLDKLDKLPAFNKLLERFDNGQKEENIADEVADSINYISLVNRMTDMMIQNNTVMMTQLIHPDILAEMPMNQFPTFAFDQTEEIIELGRQLMSTAIDNYEQQQQ